jgi:hypothetical protein
MPQNYHETPQQNANARNRTEVHVHASAWYG